MSDGRLYGEEFTCAKCDCKFEALTDRGVVISRNQLCEMCELDGYYMERHESGDYVFRDGKLVRKLDNQEMV